jgi:hypothetical protein
MPSAVPNDLIHTFLYYLKDEPEALHACARVHSSWTISAQQHLFYRVVLDSDPARLRRLVNVLDGNPALGSLIRDLVAFFSPLVEAEMIAIAPHLQQVHTLACEMAWYTQYTMIQILIDSLPELKTLSVNDSGPFSSTHRSTFRTDHPQTTSWRSIALRDLVIHNNIDMTLTYWLNHVLDTSSLTSLSCYCRGGDTTSPDYRHILDMLQRCPNLRSMHIDASEQGWENFKHEFFCKRFWLRTLGRALIQSVCRPHGLGARDA